MFLSIYDTSFIIYRISGIGDLKNVKERPFDKQVLFNGKDLKHGDWVQAFINDTTAKVMDTQTQLMLDKERREKANVTSIDF